VSPLRGNGQDGPAEAMTELLKAYPELGVRLAERGVCDATAGRGWRAATAMHRRGWLAAASWPERPGIGEKPLEGGSEPAASAAQLQAAEANWMLQMQPPSSSWQLNPAPVDRPLFLGWSGS